MFNVWICWDWTLVLWKKNLPGRGLTKVEKHRVRHLYESALPEGSAARTGIRPKSEEKIAGITPESVCPYVPAGYDSLWRHDHLDTGSLDMFGSPDHPWALWETSILPSFCILTTPPARSGLCWPSQSTCRSRRISLPTATRTERSPAVNILRETWKVSIYGAAFSDRTIALVYCIFSAEC